VTHVDDLLVTASTQHIKFFASSLSRFFKIKENGPVSFAMGMEFSRSGNDYYLTQTKYADQILRHFGYENSKSSPSPMSNTTIVNTKRNQLMDYPLNEIVGCLLWLAKSTRPDLAFSTSFLAQHVQNPTPEVYTLAGRVLRYLKGTTTFGLRMKSQTLSAPLELYADADWASDVSRKSHTGVIAYYGSSPIAWVSKKQTTISLSSTEAELIAACEATTLAKWFTNLFQELHLPLTFPVTIYDDNAGAIFLSNNSVQGKRMKHIDIKWHFINDEVKAGLVKLVKVPTQINVADILTKALAIPKFREFLPRIVTTFSSSSKAVSTPSFPAPMP